MTLTDIKNTFKTTSLAHKEVKGFDYGESYDVGTIGYHEYPFVFLEIPYLQTYDTLNINEKTIQFALLVLINTKPDDWEDDHKAISDADIIGDAIISKIYNENKRSFIFNNITSVSLREFSDDDVAGQRFEFTITTKRNFCGDNYKDKFN